MFSVPISMAVLALLSFLGIKLSAAQSAMVVGGVILAVKLLIGLGAVSFVTKGWQKFSKRPSADSAAPTAPERVDGGS